MYNQSHLKPQFLLKNEKHIYPDVWHSKIIERANLPSEYPKLRPQKIVKQDLQYSQHWSSVDSFVLNE